MRPGTKPERGDGGCQCLRGRGVSEVEVCRVEIKDQTAGCFGWLVGSFLLLVQVGGPEAVLASGTPLPPARPDSQMVLPSFASRGHEPLSPSLPARVITSWIGKIGRHDQDQSLLEQLWNASVTVGEGAAKALEALEA